MNSASGHKSHRGMRFFLSSEGWPYMLVPMIPLAVILDFGGGGTATLIFITAAIGLVPAAAIMGRATEELAARSGPGIGGLLNVTFGNFPELVIAGIALNAGLHEVVKASIVGSVIGNILLVMGAAMLVGGIGRERQKFNATAAQIQSSMLFLALAALMMPAVFELVEGQGLPLPNAEIINYDSTVEKLSAITAGILLLSYIGGLIFSLRTHRALFNPVEGEKEEFSWTVRKSIGVLAAASIVVGLMSEILVGSIEEASHAIGLSEFFVGAFVVAIVGNAAEHWVAVLVAHKDKMDLAVNISIGSSAQIALFVAPLLVLGSFFIGPHPMPLVFNGFEIAGLVIAVITAQILTSDGESTWFEGVQLLALYAVIGTAFYFA
ncbi:MAG TPA: calcium/proton exchanger [Solirubrobacterales bacterium]|nr:calcium/proton exchanger [Solirubrobacterales bacterium]